MQYSQILRVQANALAVGIFNKYVSPVLTTCMAKPYNINGDVMERRSGDFDLLHQLRELMPTIAFIDSQTPSEKKRTSAISNRSSTYNLCGDQKVRDLEKAGRPGDATGAGKSSSNVDSASTAEYPDPILSGCRVVRDLLGNRMSSAARSEVSVNFLMFPHLSIVSVIYEFCEHVAFSVRTEIEPHVVIQ